MTSEIKPLTKSKLIDKIAEEANMPRKHAERVVNKIFTSMTDTLVDHGRIEIRGFGSFAVKDYPPYQGRNPRTGAVVQVPAKSAIKFKVGKNLRERVNVS